MKNKHVAVLLLTLVLVLFFIIFSYNNTLEKIVATTCTHGESCPMYGTINVQKTISYGLIVLLAVASTIFFFRKDEPSIIHNVVEKETKSERKIDLSKLDEEEKQIVQLLQIHEGSMYQSDMIKETNWTKVRVTRLLDKLEGKKVIDRKRRGLANVVILQ